MWSPVRNGGRFSQGGEEGPAGIPGMWGSILLYDWPLNLRRRKPFHAGVWMPLTRGWDSIPKPYLGHHLWPWCSGPQEGRSEPEGSQPGAHRQTPTLWRELSLGEGDPCLCHYTSPYLLGSHPSPASTARRPKPRFNLAPTLYCCPSQCTPEGIQQGNR